VLGGPGPGRCDGLQATDQQVVDGSRRRGTRKAEAARQLLERCGALGRPQVEVAAEQQRPFARPFHGGCGRLQDVFGGQFGTVVRGVEVGDAYPRAGAGESHCPPLGPAHVNCHLVPLRNAVQASIRADEGEI